MSARTNNLLHEGSSISQRSKSCEDIRIDFPSDTVFQPFDTIESHISATTLTTSQSSLISLLSLSEENLDECYPQSDSDSGQFTSSVASLSFSNQRSGFSSNNESTSSSYESVPSFSQYKSGLILSKNVSAPSLSENESEQELSLPEVESALNLSKDDQELSLPEVESALNLSKDDQELSLPEVESVLHSSKDEQAQSSFKYESAPSLCNDESSSGSLSNESVLSSAKDDVVTKCMDDFVIVHTDEDFEKATECKEKIIEDLKAKKATVHLFSEIGLGKTTFQSVQSLHDIYRYILVYVGESLVHDYKYKFLLEMLIMAGFKGKENKNERVVPIFTKECSSGNLELDIIKGINYYQRNTCNSAYLRGLQTFLKLARERFPC